MKRLIVLVTTLLLLAACGQQETSGNNNTEEPEQEEASQEITNEETESGKEDETQEKEKEEEESEEASESEDDEADQKPDSPMYKLTDAWNFEPINDAESKVVLLTIDDAPDQYAVEMAKILKKQKAPAIFFVNGHFIDSDEDKKKLKQIHDMGFPIGNHTNTHASLPDLSKKEQSEEIVGLNDKIEKIIGERPDFFRAPFGQNTDYSKQLAKEEGMLVMNWTYGYDWNEKYTNASDLADIMVNTSLLNNGANLLMHDREWTANALDDIIKGLKEKGYGLIDPDTIRVPGQSEE
ncbi:polysaccharide deacetylase family protein [Thalassobacillus sp. CUG 92003]|uniref:polysaccharide deacetylase family protein n=1 Tax=Thalassobacillus sp. CUG 92003 TaxID=2736641 RepID=UPI0015E78A87|nr:polysaccharide deacetylase family protein [Thalassobacillus sp. CUG 92003]